MDSIRVPELLLLLLLSACKSKEKYTPPYYSTSSTFVDETSQTTAVLTSGDIVEVPFEESGGLKLLSVELNGTFTVRMILDSGCSGALISVAEAQHLYSKGVLTENDFLGKAKAMIADGSVVENMVVNLREVVIGGKIICPNVEATVSSNTKAPLLLGNEVLNRTTSYTVDNYNKKIYFKLN